MIASFFHTVVYTPLYNALIGLLDIGPWFDLGLAVITLTLVVKFLLFPLSMRAARTQRLMKELEAPMKEIKEKYKDDREKQGKLLLDLYKEKGVNPFSGFITLFIQLPVIFGLYFVFARAGLPHVNTDLLYAFIPVPHDVHMLFLGLIDLAGKSIPLAVLAGISQFFQAHFALPKPAPRKDGATFQEDFARSMQLQMKFVLPVVITGVAYVASSAVALYWITSNIFAIGQELYVKRRLEQEGLIHTGTSDH